MRGCRFFRHNEVGCNSRCDKIVPGFRKKRHGRRPKGQYSSQIAESAGISKTPGRKPLWVQVPLPVFSHCSILLFLRFLWFSGGLSPGSAGPPSPRGARRGAARQLGLGWLRARYTAGLFRGFLLLSSGARPPECPATGAPGRGVGWGPVLGSGLEKSRWL